jgi:hemerythrin-like domain-containing protein
MDKATSTVKGGAKQMGQVVRGRFGIYSTLSKEHGKVSGLMSRLAATDSDEVERRQELFDEIKDELTTHSEIEDAVFYTELASHPQLAEKIAHAREEHEEIETLLEELDAMRIEHQSWMNKFLRLQDTVQHHVDDEEGEIFPMAEKVLSGEDAERLDEEFLARRRQA